MNNNTHKSSTPFKNQELNLGFIKTVSLQLKKPLCWVAIVAILSGCAAFSGRETAGEYVDDASITASVKNEIFKDPALKMFQIHVETFKNQVQLSGFVDSLGESAKAAQIARSVNGVEGVKNSIVVRKRTLRGR